MSTLKSGKTTPSGSYDNVSSIAVDQEIGENLDMLKIDLLDRMDIQDIIELKRHFFDELKLKETNTKTKTEAEIHGVRLGRHEFGQIMEEISGSSMILLPAAKLFDCLDEKKKGTIVWEDVLDGIIAKTAKPLERKQENWQPLQPDVTIHCASHCKREFIVKVISLRTKLTFCYAVVSKLGRVGVYDGEFNLLDTYKIGLKPSRASREFLTAEQEERQKRSVTTWVTDAMFVPDTYAIFFSTSDRSLHLYDATGLIHVPLCLISGLKNTPTCLDYYSSSMADRTFLFFGDDQGDVTIMKFHQPKKSLFRKKDPDKLDKFLWEELKEQPDYVTIRTHRKVHCEQVIQVSYSPESKTILTCSNDPVNTMVLRHIEKRRRPYVFRVPRGIKCFHMEKSLHIIATGSKDGIVRVWNRVVTKQPIISLHGHRESIVDVRILRHMSLIMSLSEKCVVKAWNLNEYYCQMTVQLNFPIFQMSSRVEFGTRSIFPGPTITDVFEELAFSDSKSTSKINSFVEDIETWSFTRDFETRNGADWKRNSVAVICCNFIALLKLNLASVAPEDEAHVPNFLRKYKMLPPPSRELYASVPSPWKIADSFTKTPPEESEDGSTTTKSSGSSSTKNIAVSSNLKKVHNITSDPVTAPMRNMNMKKTQLQIKQDQMKMLVEHCAPHLALDLYDLAPLKFSRPLPVTQKMMERGVDVSDPEHLLKGKLQKDSTVTTGDTFSDGLSPSSSKNSKLAAAKGKSQVGKGRQTPEWFADGIKISYRNLSESEDEILN
ncbi:hypothetical protein RUM43_005131 [Polyplax serrata]|uniref:WD repeat-containing protein on Y chromosome n=1 Tax=Polyplax serrata TaxID=468196 RepID=A0AAN8SEZ8_POLSC